MLARQIQISRQPYKNIQPGNSVGVSKRVESQQKFEKILQFSNNIEKSLDEMRTDIDKYKDLLKKNNLMQMRSQISQDGSHPHQLEKLQLIDKRLRGVKFAED